MSLLNSDFVRSSGLAIFAALLPTAAAHTIIVGHHGEEEFRAAAGALGTKRFVHTGQLDRSSEIVSKP